MRPILIGAGRGSRLEHETEELPKTLVSVMGKPMLEHILDALGEAGFARRDVIFICGYKADVLRARYPELTYVENARWASNNILLSLMCARALMSEGFLCSYTDIVYTGQVVKDLVAAPGAKVLGCDTDWRRRYTKRNQHPETDAEKLTAEGSRVTRISRWINPAEAAGEYIGVAKVTADGAREICHAFDEAKDLYMGGVFREGRPFERAYLIDLFQWMIEEGASFDRVDTHGGYMEIDTLEDLALAEEWWKGRQS